jgi:hypothetical protein
MPENQTRSVTSEMLNTLENELLANQKNWEFNGHQIECVCHEEDYLAIGFENGAQLTLRITAEGKEVRCPVCDEVKGGWPDWWSNVATESNRLIYACADCAERAKGRGHGEAKDGECETALGDRPQHSGR